MTSNDILKLRDAAEQTKVQFKERITRDNRYDVVCEMVAFSNSLGGMIVIGIDDKKGSINPLSFKEIQETTNVLGSLASEGIVPSILIDVENVPMQNGAVVVAKIKQGVNKPYRDNKGVIWVKQGADKRKVFDNAELVAMLMENGQVHPDAMPINGTSISDLDEVIVREYLIKRFRNEFEKQQYTIGELQHSPVIELASMVGQTPEGILKNVGLILPNGTLTLAALMLMGKYPQKWLPAFTVRCVSFVGNNIGGTEFRDKSGGDADGNAVHLYKYIMSFLTRNLRQVQVENEFNSQGELEVSATTLSEMVVNAILHRSYVIEAPLRVFIFDNRIEIHSPGLLPEGVSVDSIKLGISVPRNKLLFNHGIHLLPYTGAGSGIARALRFTPDISLVNDEKVNEFVVKIVREEVLENDRDKDREDRDNGLKNNDIEKCVEGGSDRESDRDKIKEVGRVPYKKLEGIQKNIIQFCTLPRTSREILEHIGYGYNSTNMAKFIKPLLEMGYIEMTNPEKPNSKGQKYRKVNSE